MDVAVLMFAMVAVITEGNSGWVCIAREIKMRSVMEGQHICLFMYSYFRAYILSTCVYGFTFAWNQITLTATRSRRE